MKQLNMTAKYVNVSQVILMGIYFAVGIVSVAAFIYGSAEPSREYWSGTFFGGWLPTVALSGLCFALVGFYAAYSRSTMLLAGTTLVGGVSMFIRLISWLMVWFHRKDTSDEIYWMVAIEMGLVICGVILLHANLVRDGRANSVSDEDGASDGSSAGGRRYCSSFKV